jgi:hypothetical protein
MPPSGSCSITRSRLRHHRDRRAGLRPAREAFRRRVAGAVAFVVPVDVFDLRIRLPGSGGPSPKKLYYPHRFPVISPCGGGGRRTSTPGRRRPRAVGDHPQVPPPFVLRPGRFLFLLLTTLSTKEAISSCRTAMGVMRRIHESPWRQRTGTPVRPVNSLRTMLMMLQVCLQAWWPE